MQRWRRDNDGVMAEMWDGFIYVDGDDGGYKTMGTWCWEHSPPTAIRDSAHFYLAFDGLTDMW